VQAPARVAFIDGLRGIAVLVILLYHAWIFAGSPLSSPWNPLHYGYTGVHLFLVLSGFCVYWPFARGRPLTLRQFAARRFRRIAPPFYCAALLWSVWAIVAAQVGWPFPEHPGAVLSAAALQDFALHVLFLHNTLPDHALAIAGPFWSIGLEVQLYALMPLLAYLAARSNIKIAVLFACGVTLFVRCGTLYYAHVQIRPDLAFVLNSSVFGRWGEFALGMYAAQLVANPPAVSLSASAHPRCRQPWLLRGLLTLLLAPLYLYWSHEGPLCDLLFGLGFFFLILAGAQPAAHVATQPKDAPAPLPGRSYPPPAPPSAPARSPFVRLLLSRPLAGIGLFSYSIYLVHQPLLRLLIDLLHHHTPPTLPAPLFHFLVLLATLPTLAASYLFFVVVERRFINGPKPGGGGDVRNAESGMRNGGGLEVVG
jgi:peptidoglycan/LPS O-acetylase OafA/YrhL